MKSRTVYPVAGLYLNGVPHVEHECEDPVCVESGAFTHDPPPKADKQPKARQDAGPSDSEE